MPEEVQNPTRCIGSNQAIGYVQIQPEDKSQLIEKSARTDSRKMQLLINLKRSQNRL